MERVRSLSRSAGLVMTAVVVAGGLGCASTASMTEAVHSVRRQVLDERPVPATQVGCLMQQRLSSLPDPTRDGQMIPGLAGTVFLLTQAGTGAEVDGDLAVMVYDDTPRPPGVKGHDPELWHFNRDTLARLATVHEWFGPCYAIFLPWPANWKDVTQVRIQARYESKGYPTLFSQPQPVTLDFSRGGNAVVSHDQFLSAPTFAGPVNGSVPDPQRYIQEAARKLEAQRQAARGSGSEVFPASSIAPAALTGQNPGQTRWPVIPNQPLPSPITLGPDGSRQPPSGPASPVVQPGPVTAPPVGLGDAARPIVLPDRIGQ